MARIDMHLKAEMAQGRGQQPPSRLRVQVRHQGSLDALVDAGLEPLNVGPRLVVGLATADVIEVLARLPEVDSIESLGQERLLLDRSVTVVRANAAWARQGDQFTGYTGRGVIVGIVDTGLDFRHPSFRRADGTSRVLRIWDQTLVAREGETVPGPITHPDIAIESVSLGYGVEYTCRQINDVLDAEAAAREGRTVPAVTPVRHVDKDGHGTHVAGIAAGDGSQPGHGHPAYTYVGVAPEADLLIVRVAGLTDGDKLPERAGRPTLEGIRYLLDRAREFEQPMVINVSIGKFSPDIDGTDPTCKAVDDLLQRHPQGRSIVFSAGNDADGERHVHAVVRPGDAHVIDLNFRVSSKTTKPCVFTLRYAGTDLQVLLTTPLGETSLHWLGVGRERSHPGLDGPGSRVSIDNQPGQVQVGLLNEDDRSHVDGTWTVQLKNTGEADLPIDAYITCNDVDHPDAVWFLNAVSPRSTLSVLAAGHETVSVGSSHAGQLSEFSSRGPTLDQPPRQLKPEIVAPGEHIASAGIPRNRDICCCAHILCACCDSSDADYHWYVDMAGTSMAAPHVTGAVALMLHKNPNLTNRQIRQLLMDHASPPPAQASADDRAGWGAGLLNVQQTLDAVERVHPPVEPLATPQSMFRQLQASVMDLPQGPQLQAVVATHGQEVWTLIQTHRRVATAWHRSHGPVWVRLALGALSAPDEPIDMQADRQALRDSVKRLAQSLDRHGSPALRDAVRAWAPVLAALPARASLRQLLQALARSAPAAARTGATP